MSTTYCSSKEFYGDVVLRILDRLSSHSQKAAEAIKSESPEGRPMFNAPNGMCVFGNDIGKLLKEASEKACGLLEKELALNPSVTSVTKGSVNFIEIGDDVNKNLKAVESKLSGQLKAVEKTGSFALVYMSDFHNWNGASKSKIFQALSKNSCPRIFLVVDGGIDCNIDVYSQTLLSKMASVKVQG